MTQSNIETRTVATRITKSMFRGIQTVLAVSTHLNVADYVRDLIRKDLESRNIKTEVDVR